MDFRRSMATVLSLACVTALACETLPVDSSLAYQAEQDDFVMLPAWQTAAEKTKKGKADSASDFRFAHPEWYAATEPPKGKKFRALLEWEPSRYLLLAYPSAGMGSSVSTSIAMIAVHAAPHSDVYIVSKAAGAQQNIIDLIKKGGLSQDLIDDKIHFFEFEADSIWMIDFGPFPLVDEAGTLAFTDLRYYHERAWDDAVPARVALEWGITDYRGQMNYEGGNFVTDGNGLCYASQGMYWENANQTDSVDKVLKDYLGCEKLAILKPLDGEGTTHIDMFFKLTDENTAVLGEYTEQQDATNKKTLDDDFDILAALTPPGGGHMNVNRIPMPPNSDGTGKVWRTYTNSTFVKPVNIWPVYTDYQDIQSKAEDVWKTTMPGWEHIGVLSDVIITWGGAMHCVSRNVPDAMFEKWVGDGTCESGKCNAPADGYSGDCDGNGDCYGPEWLCGCNDCSTGCVPPVDECNGITYDGCCTLEGKLQYCENNAIQTVDCGTWDQCGWDQNNNWYDCGFSGEGPDGYPKACPGEAPCGDVPDEGVCEGDVLKWCEGEKVNETDCAAAGDACGTGQDGKPACVCKDECNDGDAECLDYPGGRAVCKMGADGCHEMVSEPCDAGYDCDAGACVAQPKPDASATDVGFPDNASSENGSAADGVTGVDATSSISGGGKCSASTTPMTPWTVLLIAPLMLLVAVRRRA